MNNFKKIWKKYRRPLITLGSALFILAGTLFAIQYAKGYRPTIEGTLEGTGLLSANSNPEGSQVYIDGELQNVVTNETINLDPGDYFIEIKKDGYIPWSKQMRIEAELVTDTDAHLFRAVPSLSPLTFSGAKNITPSPDGEKIAYTIASPSAQLEAGLYVMDITERTVRFSRGPRLIAENIGQLDFANAKLLWSPDSSQILASFNTVNYLLEADRTTSSQQLTNITYALSQTLATWEEEITRREKQLLLQLPLEMFEIVTTSAKNIYFSPNGEKMLYTATKRVTIPDKLTSHLPASNSQPENRTIEPGDIYVYDIKEDKNFKILTQPAELPESEFTKFQLVTDISEQSLFATPDATSSAVYNFKLRDPESLENTINNFRAQYSSFPFTNYQWFPTSKHILVNTGGTVSIVEYDATNFTNIFSGNFLDDFVYPWTTGSKLIILTNVTQNPAFPPNLYTIELK